MSKIDWNKPVMFVEGFSGVYKGQLTFVAINPVDNEEVILIVNNSSFLKVNKKTGQSKTGAIAVVNAPEPWIKAMNDWTKRTGFSLDPERQEIFKAGFLAGVKK